MLLIKIRLSIIQYHIRQYVRPKLQFGQLVICKVPYLEHLPIIARQCICKLMPQTILGITS
jgi:hypothetical protein